mmetsp:Transcript_29119/g.79506  ORF Transcript_29119/g.79506 Transcript_29119/m.79506 type:complete len:870 (+) Transcript_29119:94-2703(+)
MEAADSARHRAKVYCLNANGNWDDRGTGHAAVQYSPAEQAAFVVVISEDEGHQTLLQARVHMEDIYQRQQETIVSWNEPVTGVDYALSFQDAEGCTDLWEQICSLQGRSPDDRGASDIEASGASSGYGMTDTVVELPAAELRNVAAIAELINDMPMFKRQRLVELILSSDYIPQLVKLFGVAEDLEQMDDLHHIYSIFKGLVLLNDGSIYELLLRDDLVMPVFGALEYDPEMAAGQRAGHRAFFEGGKRFKLVIPITDETVLKKIHQNYHLSFLKDVVLPRALDDNAFAALNQIAFCNNVHIVSSLSNDSTFFQSLRDKIADASQEPPALLDALRLLQELCTIAKQLQLYNRSNFYRKFCEHACFAPLAGALRRPQPEIRLAALEILLASIQHEPSLLRQAIVTQRPEYELCHALISVLTGPGGSGEKPQVAEVLRALLDPESMAGRERDEFLNLFYEEFVDKVAEPVTGKVLAGAGPPVNGETPPANGPSAAGSGDNAGIQDDILDDVLSARQHVCELLSFFVMKHTHRIKYFILRNQVLLRVLKLVRSRDKGLVLAAIRFLRTCIGIQDEFYNRYLVKNRCFDSLIMQLRVNVGRDNLVHSAILELLEFIRKENVHSLVSHLAHEYAEPFAEFTHVDIFKGIMLRDAQNAESGAHEGSATGPASVAARPVAAGDPPPGGRRVFGGDDDEDYFNESDDDELSGTNTVPDSVDERQFVPRPISTVADDSPERELHRLGVAAPPRLPAVLEMARRGGTTSPPLGTHSSSPPLHSPPRLPVSPTLAPAHGAAPSLALPPAAAPIADTLGVNPISGKEVGSSKTSSQPAHGKEDAGHDERERLTGSDVEALGRKRQRIEAVGGDTAEGEWYT